MKAITFNKLLKRLKKDGESFTYLYRFYKPRIHEYISKIYHCKELGLDVAHQFFLELFQNGYRNYIKNPIAWVYKVCDHIAGRLILSEETYNLAFKDDAVGSPDDSYEYVIYQEYIAQIENLEPKTREIVKLYVWEDMSLKCIAEKLNLSYDAVRKKFQRAKKKIKKI